MQYDKKLLLQMINDPSVPNDEKQMYKELVEAKEGADYFEKKVEVKEEVKVMKPAAKKKAAKKKKKTKVSEENLAKAKAAIKKRTGKTEEECEKIIGEYKKLRGKATKRKKQETERVSKLKKEGKVIKGTDEKTPAAAIDTTAKQVEDKIEKEVKKTERKAKKVVSKKDISAEKKKEEVAKKVSKKIATMTRSAITSTNKLISSTLSELKKVDKSEAKDYLLGLRAKIDTMLKKFDDGGMVQGYDIQEGLISVGNNASYARGGSVITPFTDNVNQWVMHSYNWDTGADGKPKFFEAFGEPNNSLRNHLYNKWRDYYVREGSGGVMNRFWTELSSNNQVLLANWIKENYTNYAPGGKMQGYNDKLDESLGMRHRGSHKQSHKDRRDESKGMEKGSGRRAYKSVGTMDDNDTEDYERYYKMKKGGKTNSNWGQKVEDSPNFDEGGFRREAAKRGLTTQELFNRVMKNPQKYPDKMHEQAIFMQNFYKFKTT